MRRGRGTCLSSFGVAEWDDQTIKYFAVPPPSATSFSADRNAFDHCCGWNSYSENAK